MGASRDRGPVLPCVVSLSKTFYPLPITGPEVIKLFSYSTQLSTKFFLLMNVKMSTIVGILTFISMINTTSETLLYLSVFQFL